jgi:hypothetical protein
VPVAHGSGGKTRLHLQRSSAEAGGIDVGRSVSTPGPKTTPDRPSTACVAHWVDPVIRPLRWDLNRVDPEMQPLPRRTASGLYRARTAARTRNRCGNPSGVGVDCDHS